MKRVVLIVIVGLVIFSTVYYFTGSWKLSLIAVPLMSAYLIWIACAELGLCRSKEERERTEKEMYGQSKRAHEQTAKNNPTLR